MRTDRKSHRDRVVRRRDRSMVSAVEALEERQLLSVSIAIGNAAVIEGSSGVRAMAFKVTRSGDLDKAVTLSYATQNGTAKAGQDYVARSGTITIPAGKTVGVIRVAILGDTVAENDETLRVRLTGVTEVTPASAAFSAASSFDTGSTPKGVAVGDINGDGRPDLVVADSGDNTLSIFLNKSARGAAKPSFAPAQQVLTAIGPTGIALGDLNNDGKLDIAVACANSTKVSVLINGTGTGAGTVAFAPRVDLAASASPSALTIADLNNDGRNDLAIVNNTNFGYVSVFLNNTVDTATAPSFGARFTIAPDPQRLRFPSDIAAADVDQDGKVDLMVTEAGSDTLDIFLNTTNPNTPTPSFAYPVQYGTAAKPLAVATADFNADGAPDIVTASPLTETAQSHGQLDWRIHETLSASPGFDYSAGTTASTTPLPARSVVVADFNGDGKPDVAVANSGYDFDAFGAVVQTHDSVSVFVNKTAAGHTTLNMGSALTINPQTGMRTDYIAAGDLNGDGSDDIVVSNTLGNSVSVMLSKPAATITRATGVGTIRNDDGPVPQVPDIRVLQLDGSHVSVLASGAASAVSFGTVRKGARAPAVTIRIRNLGTSTLDIKSVHLPAGYRLAERLSTTTLAPNHWVTFEVRMTTSTAGVRTGTMTIASNDPDTPVFQVKLSGTVTA